MLHRIGFVLYTLSWVLAAPLLALMVWGWGNGIISGSGQVVLGSTAILSLLIGRGLYYVLAGR